MFRTVFSVFALITLCLVMQVYTYNVEAEEVIENYMDPDIIKYLTDDELIRQIQTMMSASKGEINSGRNEASVNTKYKTWKRNADLINALLALPKGMTDAGR